MRDGAAAPSDRGSTTIGLTCGHPRTRPQGRSETADGISISEGAALDAVPSGVALSGLDQTDNAFLDIRLDLP